MQFVKGTGGCGEVEGVGQMSHFSMARLCNGWTGPTLPGAEEAVKLVSGVRASFPSFPCSPPRVLMERSCLSGSGFIGPWLEAG